MWYLSDPEPSGGSRYAKKLLYAEWQRCSTPIVGLAALRVPPLLGLRTAVSGHLKTGATDHSHQTGRAFSWQFF